MSDPSPSGVVGDLEAALQTCTQELDRVSTRLGRAPERHWPGNASLAHACAQRLRALDLAMGAEGPAAVPVIADRAAAAQLNVIAVDLMATARHHVDGAPSLTIAAELLATLRRELP